jgi:hypothetical protein
MTEAKAFRRVIRIYFQFKSECLRANIKLTLHKALTRSVITHACPTCELQLLQRRFSAPLEIFQGVDWSAICTRLSTFCMCTII